MLYYFNPNNQGTDDETSTKAFMGVLVNEYLKDVSTGRLTVEPSCAAHREYQGTATADKNHSRKCR